MIGNENFTSSEKLSILLDGELKREESGTLFYELANDSELQEEFHEMVDLKNMFKDTNLTPPTGLHSNIIAGTGLAGESATRPAKSASGFLGSKVSLVLFSCLTGAFITFLLMNNFGSGIDNIAGANIPAAHQGATIRGYSQKSSVQPVGSNINGSSSINNSNNSNNSNNNAINNTINPDNKPARFASLPSDISDTEYNKSGIGRAANPPIGNPSSRPVSVVSDDIGTASEHLTSIGNSTGTKPRMIVNHRDLSSNAFNTVYVPMEELRQSRIHSDKEWAIALRGFTSNTMSDIEIKPLYNPGLNNFSISLMRDLGDNFSFGLEFGQENFIQQFSGEFKGRVANVKQNYLAFWGGAAARYMLDPVDWLDGVQPYGRLFFGSTYLGPLMKEEVGLQYFISKDFAMFFGVELSHLAYFYKDKTFFSNKFGTSYGVIIKF